MCNMKFELRKILEADWELLLKWRNDINSRRWFYDDNILDEKSHIEYVKKVVNRTYAHIDQYILFIDDKPVGTIKSVNKEDLCIQPKNYLSYTIDNQFRGKNLSVIMIQLFLYNKTGKFVCEIKESNIPSIKMVKRVGFKLQNIDTNKNILTYIINK